MRGKEKTSKNRLRAKVRAVGAADALVEARTSPAASVADEDGLTPRHHAAIRARIGDRKSYAKIAEKLGVSITTVGRLLKEGFDRLEKLQAETLTRVREMDIASLDELQAEWMPRAVKSGKKPGEKAAAELVLKIIKSRKQILRYSDELDDKTPDGEIDVPTWTPLDEDAPLIADDADDVKLNDALARATEGTDAVR